MLKVNILVIGGSAAGIVVAKTAKAKNPKKSVLVIRKEKYVMVPCGIPYVFNCLKNTGCDLIPDKVLTGAGIDLKIGAVDFIDKKKKICLLQNGDYVKFDKLIIATGSEPFIPNNLAGVELKNVFTIPKNRPYLDAVLKKISKSKKIVIVGGGFIGLEVADELSKRKKQTVIVEMLPNLLGQVFDKEFSLKAEEVILKQNVGIKTNSKVKEIIGDKQGKVKEVLLNNGERIKADIVILSIGYRPNNKLAEKSKIKLNKLGFIKVDKNMCTDDPYIFAVGDCAEKKDFFTKKSCNSMLASIACNEAKVAGFNLYKESKINLAKGTISIFSTMINGLALAAAGMTESQAKKNKFEVVSGFFEGVDKHPSALPNTNKQAVKLIFNKKTGIILGGQVTGGVSVGELINFIGLAVQNKMTAQAIMMTQIGTHPLLSAPPTAYPFLKAAGMALKKIKK